MTRTSLLFIYLLWIVLTDLVTSTHHSHKRRHPNNYHHRHQYYSHSNYRSTESNEDDKFLKECNKYCKCSQNVDLSATVRNILNPAEASIDDDYLVQCSSIKNLWSLGQLQGFTSMSIQLEVSDNNVVKINGSCSEENVGNRVTCFSTDKLFPLLKSVYSLALKGFKSLKVLGKGFFTLMPNLRSLTLNLGAGHNVDVYFSYSTQNLKSLETMLSPGEDLRIRCRNKVCMPSLLQTLAIRYSQSSNIKFMDSQRFSKTIKDLKILSSGGSQDVDFLKGSNVQNLKMNLQDNDDLALSLDGVEITKTFSVNLNQIQSGNQHLRLLSKIYQDENAKQLATFRLTNNRDNLFPAIIGNSETTFNKEFFGACHLSRSILGNSKQTISTAEEGSKRLLLREWYIDLKSIHDKGLFEEYDEIVVTAYHIDISRTFQISIEKKLTVYYFEIGASSKTPKAFQGVLVKVTNSVNFTIKDLNAQVVPYQLSTATDAIFARAIALCVLKNAGVYEKRKAGSEDLFDLKSKEFWKISRMLPDNVTFAPEYTNTEKSLAWEALANMNKYLHMTLRKNSKMRELSEVTLQPLSEGEYSLVKYGKKIAEDQKIDFNKVSATQLKKLAKTISWTSMDHLYHMITVYKERVNQVFDSHVNDRPLLFQLVTMFNEYKKQVDENENLFEKVSKRTNSYRNTKTIMIIVRSLSLLFEDKKAFEHTIKSTDDEWKPSKTEIVVENLKSIRNLMLTLDEMSISFGRLRNKIESKQQQFLKYVDTIVKLLDRILSSMSKSYLTDADRRNVKILLDISGKLITMKQEIQWPDQIVKTVNLITKALEIGKKLPRKQRIIFEKIPDPVSYFPAREVYRLYRKGLTITPDVCQGWKEVKDWLKGVLNSTTVSHLFQKLSVRYPITNMVETAEKITQEMVSNYGYQMNLIEAYISYIVGYNKAFTLYRISQNLTKYSTDSNQAKMQQITDIKFHIENEKMSLKLDLLHNIKLWCNVYYYKNFMQCPLDFRDTSMADPLVDLVDVYSFQVTHIDALTRIKEPEATFIQEYNFTLPSYCRCFTKNTQQSSFSVFLDGDESGYMNDFACAQRNIKATEGRDTDSLEDLLGIANTCFNNKIRQLHSFNAFSLSIDSQNVDFANKVNVLVSKIDVFLHGAKTITHELKIYIANHGVYEIKTNNNVKVVYEDTLLQEVLYSVDSNHTVSIENTTSRSYVRESPARSDVTDTNRAISNLPNFELKDKISSATMDYLQMSNGQTQNIYTRNNLIVDSDFDTEGAGKTSDSVESKYRIKLNKSLFTNWLFIVPADQNDGLDIASVKKITVKIHGTFKSFLKKSAFFL